MTTETGGRLKSLSEVKDEVKDRSDLMALVSKHTKLVKTSTGAKACCPLPGHAEKTPSFHVDARKNLYFCYGCQRGGDVFKFLEEVEGLSFMEALKELAEELGIELPKMNKKDVGRAKEEKSQREQGLDVLQRSATFFQKMLESPSSDAKKCGAYLRETRGLSDEEIAELGLGWAANESQLLAKRLHGAGLLNVAEEAGLVRNYSGRFYDFFQDRLMIPIKDRRGRVCGFSGRTLGEVGPKNPKYKNSPEGFLFKKKEILYGLDRAVPLINSKDFVCLVEGFFDQWAFHRAGIPAVAVMGTALTPSHLKELERFTRRMVLVLDADAAGVASTKRSLPLLREASWDARVFSEMDGKDPDEWLKDREMSEDELLRTLKGAPDGLEWLIQQELEDARRQQLGRSQTLGKVRVLWNQASDSSHKELLLNPIATFLGLKVEELRELLKASGADASAMREAKERSDSLSLEAPDRYEPFKDRSLSRNTLDRAAEEVFVWWLRYWDELAPEGAEVWKEREELFAETLAGPFVESARAEFEATQQCPPLSWVESQVSSQDDSLLRSWMLRGLVAPEERGERNTADKALISFGELAYSLKKEKTQVQIARIEQELRRPLTEARTIELLQQVQQLRIKLENRN